MKRQRRVTMCDGSPLAGISTGDSALVQSQIGLGEAIFGTGEART
jgi:hypothetical protein